MEKKFSETAMVLSKAMQGKSQKEVARKVGCHPVYLGQLVHGRGRPSHELASRLEIALHLKAGSISSLLVEKASPAAATPFEEVAPTTSLTDLKRRFVADCEKAKASKEAYKTALLADKKAKEDALKAAEAAIAEVDAVILKLQPTPKETV